MKKETLYKVYSEQDIKEFMDFYKSSANDYMLEHGLGIEQEYKHNHNGNYLVKPIGDIQTISHWNTYHSNNIGFITQSDIDKKIDVENFPQQNLIWKDYKKEFYQKLYTKANDSQKTMLQQSGFLMHSLSDIVDYLNDQPHEIINYVKHAKEYYAWMIKDKYYIHSFVENLKKALNPQEFNATVVDFFTYHKKQCRNKSNYILLKYAFDNFIDDKHTLDTLNSLLPLQDKEISPFLENDIIIFEIVVDRQKLSQVITLKEKDDYNDMNSSLYTGFNKYSQSLNLIEVTMPDKIKSAKEFKFVVRAPKNSGMTVEKFQTILMGLYKQYQKLYQNVDFSYQISDLMTQQWFANHMLSSSIPEKKCVLATKKNKL